MCCKGLPVSFRCPLDCPDRVPRAVVPPDQLMICSDPFMAPDKDQRVSYFKKKENLKLKVQVLMLNCEKKGNI